MELLLILIYVSICWVVFKLFRIPVNQWSWVTAALGGIIGIALLLLIMNYNHPFTKNARIYFAVTPVLPTVRGRVVEVAVKENAPLKEGDVLFRIDPKPTNTSSSRRRPRLPRPSRTYGSSRPRSIRQRQRPNRPMRSLRWRSRTMIGNPSCSKRG
jgi:multidrug resistance efflux pump